MDKKGCGSGAKEILVSRCRLAAEGRRTAGRTPAKSHFAPLWRRPFRMGAWENSKGLFLDRSRADEHAGAEKTGADTMSQPLRSCFAARPLARISHNIVARNGVQSARFLSQTSARWEDSKDGKPDSPKTVPPKPRTESLLESIWGTSLGSSGRSTQPDSMASLSQSMVFQALNKSNIDTSVLSGAPSQATQKKEDELEPYHFHIYAHKHNTHITCTKPNREPIISMSCGNIGFRKSRRGTFDSAYSLTKYVLERLIHTGWPMKIQRLELVLRGFGQGREAAVKVLMSPEGKVLRDKIVRVADSTRIKFAGTRSEKPRRL